MCGLQRCTPGEALIPLHISAEESKMNGWHIGTRTIQRRAFICGERSMKNKWVLLVLPVLLASFLFPL